MSEAMQTPLTELLRMTPDDLRAEWPSQWAEDGREIGHTMSPIGKHCHQAADRIDKLEQQLAVSARRIETEEKISNSYLEDIAELREVVQEAFDCGMIPKSSVSDGGASKYSEQVRVADRLRELLQESSDE